MLLWCTKRSFSPPSGAMKPKPFESLNHFTVPVAIKNTSLTTHERVKEGDGPPKRALVVTHTVAAFSGTASRRLSRHPSGCESFIEVPSDRPRSVGCVRDHRAGDAAARVVRRPEVDSCIAAHQHHSVRRCVQPESEAVAPRLRRHLAAGAHHLAGPVRRHD